MESVRLRVGRATSSTQQQLGDRIVLPASVIARLQHASFTLLTFRLTSAEKSVFCGVRDFSADDGEVLLPGWMSDTLAVHVGDDVTLSLEHLPKATGVKLRPLTLAYLEIADIRATLESFLRTNFTCLTANEIIHISHYHRAAKKTCSFMVADLLPVGSRACSIIDTDIDVDIVPLQENTVPLAREFAEYKQMSALLTWSSTAEHTTLSVQGQLSQRQSHYYKLPLTADISSLAFTISLAAGDINLFMHTTIDHPSSVDNTFFDVNSGSRECTYTLQPSFTQKSHLHDDTTTLPSFLFMTVEQYGVDSTTLYSITVCKPSLPILLSPITQSDSTGNTRQCLNCHSFISDTKFSLHEAFCYRNNVHCSLCGQVMQKNVYSTHWHCPHCLASTALIFTCHISNSTKHLHYFHSDPPIHSCPACTQPSTLFSSLSQLQHHRLHLCPFRLIHCRFCKTYQQAGDSTNSAHDIIANILTEHESSCSSRTIECQKCFKMIQIRNVKTHMQYHEIIRKDQKLPFHICSNMICGNTLSLSSSNNNNEFGLCTTCFGPFWTSTIDLNHQLLLKRLVQRYFQQIQQGCGQDWCTNQYCQSSQQYLYKSSENIHFDSTDPTAVALICYQLAQTSLQQSSRRNLFHLCITQKRLAERRTIANHLVGMGWQLEWAIKALLVSEQEIKLQWELEESEEESESTTLKELTNDVWLLKAEEWLLQNSPPQL